MLTTVTSEPGYVVDMTVAFPRFAALGADHFRAVRFSERVRELCAELEASKELVEHQCLMAIVLVTTVVYLLARVVDSAWMLPFVLPIIAIGVASLQHALALYRHHVRREAMPAICEGIGRLRHAVGEAPDISLDRLVRAGLLPRHGQYMIEDAVHGEHRGSRLSLAMVDLWYDDDEMPPDEDRGDAFHGILVAVRWPEAPSAPPADDLTRLVDGAASIGFSWFEGYMLLAIPCRQNPFDMQGLFAGRDQLATELLRIASVVQIPHRLIDFMREREQMP